MGVFVMLGLQGCVCTSTSEYLSNGELGTVTIIPKSSPSEYFEKCWNGIEGVAYRNDLYGGGLTPSSGLL